LAQAAFWHSGLRNHSSRRSCGPTHSAMERKPIDDSASIAAYAEEGQAATPLLDSQERPQEKQASINNPNSASAEDFDREHECDVTKLDHRMSTKSFPIDIPESIYGAAMMTFIRSSQTYHKVVHCVSLCIFMGLILNITIQFYVLICTKLYITAPAVLAVRELYQSFHEHAFEDGVFSQDLWDDFHHSDELCQMPLSQPMFFLCILSIWTATCWVDLLDSFHFFYLWYAMPALQEQGRMTEVELVDENIVLKGATRGAKACAIGMIMVPKILIACLLWWLGARWLVATTSFQDLLLNAVALAFITELDELIYMSLMPGDIQNMVQMFKIASPPRKEKQAKAKVATQDSAAASMPDDKAQGKMVACESRGEADPDFVAFRDRRLKLLMSQMALTALVVVGFPMLYMYHLQQVLPGYKFDVHKPCESNVGSMMSMI